MRHPADSPSWRNIDYRWPAFGSEARNIRLALSADVLIFGPHEPGNDVDVYLQPLIDDLKKLWEGVICVVHICGDDTVAKYLSHSRKMCYQGHRRYLPRNHPYRKQKAVFNGQHELGQARQPLSGEEVLSLQEQIEFQFGKQVKKSKKAEKKKMLSSLMHMKLPYGHASNIKNCVSIDELKMFGMKSHDCHIMLQQLLPIAIRAVLPKNVKVTIIRLCFFFNALCNKIVDVSKLDKLQADVIITLCELEKIFPASFFDVMIHLMVHLVRELRLCGSVFYRWMYAFERFNKVLRGYVRNLYHPEGCMAESYLGEESVELCQEFVKQSGTTVGLWKDVDKLSGPLSVVTMKSIDEKEMHDEYLQSIHQGKKKSTHWLLREHNRLFADWFLEKVSSEMIENPGGVSDTIRWIAGKPSFFVMTYEGYPVDGVRYFTKERDDVRVVQNSGVSLVANTVQVSSAKDLNPIESEMTFYGFILEIRELDYHAFKAPLFLCNWADNDKGIKVDDLGFILVDLSRQGHKKDKYVSIDQVKQVYYIEDPVDPKWSVVLASTTRDYQEVYNEDELGDTTMENPPFCKQIPTCDVGDDVEPQIRENIQGTWVKK
ncbi:uncharacterized protein LOC141673544 [Apium graveolens]|uniref:uncharacterized protein LOC141673544 n=1 Tax=Apium graveolens TaxID=4045 RepID=UPI003D7972C4